MSLIQASLPAATLWICKLLLDAVALAVTDGFASPSEAFARLTSDEAVKEVRKRFDASPHQAVAIMGRPKEKEGSGWADPHKLVDRGEHLFGKRGFFAKLRTQQAADTVLSKELDVQFCNCRARPANASTTSVKDAPRYTSG